MFNNPLNWKILILVVKFIIISCVLIEVWRRGLVFKCPECDQNISKGCITPDGIDCPVCHWNLVTVSGIDSPSTESTQQHANDSTDCRRCGVWLDRENALPLFDGYSYCRDCVTNVSPQLADWAASHSVLEDLKPFRFGRALWSATCMTTLLAVIITLGYFAINLIAAVAGAVHGQWMNVLLGGAIMFGASWAFVAIVGYPYVLGFNFFKLPRSVRISDGRLSIDPPGDQAWDLADIRWAEGAGTYDQIEGICWPRRQGIMIFPHTDKEQRRLGYLVATDPENKELWHSFLRLADVTVQPLRPWKDPTEFD